MPISYRIDASRHLILTTASGILTDDDILELKRQLAVDPELQEGMCELSDVRAVTDLQVTTRGVRAMAALDATRGSVVEGYRLAIVAGQEVVFGMARMYQTLTEDSVPHIAIFRDPDEAERWLAGKGAPP